MQGHRGSCTWEKMQMYTVEIFHNVSRDGFFGLNVVHSPELGPLAPMQEARTFEECHPLVKVWEGEFDGSDFVGLLERVFTEFNVGEGPQAASYRARRLRSLSKGDVVKIDGRAYAVEGFGWSERDDSELRVIEDAAEAEALVRDRFEFRPAEELAVTVPWSA